MKASKILIALLLFVLFLSACQPQIISESAPPAPTIATSEPDATEVPILEISIPPSDPQSSDVVLDNCGFRFGSSSEGRITNKDVFITQVISKEVGGGFAGALVSVSCPDNSWGGVNFVTLQQVYPEGWVNLDCWLEPNAPVYAFSNTYADSIENPGFKKVCEISQEWKVTRLEDNMVQRCGYILPNMETNFSTVTTVNFDVNVEKVDRVISSGQPLFQTVYVTCPDGGTDEPIKFDTYDLSLQPGNTYDLMCGYVKVGGVISSRKLLTCWNLH